MIRPIVNLILDEQEGPAVLVGHSYGGVVITEAGMHPKVAALVYIAAFAPDKGESVNTIVGHIVGHPPSFTPPKEGYLFQDKGRCCTDRRLVAWVRLG